jgi:transposase
MAKARSLVGLDVHATKIVAAVLDAETGELQFFRIGGDVGEAAGLCAGLPGPVRAVYEAGPTGYGLARELGRRGVECVVAAPSKIPRASGERVKTDRRDAEHLVRLLLAGKLHPVRVPGAEEEALRDLVRARDAVRVDLMRCRHRLSKLLLRHGIRFDDGRAWTDRHRSWLANIALERPAAQATLLDAIGAVDITLMLEAGAPLTYVQDQVGHEDTKTTQEIYARVLRRQQRAKVGAAFNELMYGARELAFRAEEEALHTGGHELLMSSPFERGIEQPGS